MTYRYDEPIAAADGVLFHIYDHEQNTMHKVAVGLICAGLAHAKISGVAVIITTQMLNNAETRPIDIKSLDIAQTCPYKAIRRLDFVFNLFNANFLGCPPLLSKEVRNGNRYS